jgi:site-specific recombinase XerD
MSNTSFAPCQQRFFEHLAATQPCDQLAEWFSAVLAPFFAYLTHLGVQSVDGITPAHVAGFRAQLLETPWSPTQQSLCWEAARFPQAKQPLMFLAPAQWFYAVRLFLHFLWQGGVLPQNPADDVAALPAIQLRRRGLDELEAESLLLAPSLAVDRWQTALQVAASRRDQAVLSLLYRAGASPAELRAVKLAPFTWTYGEVYTRPSRAPARRIRLGRSTAALVQAYLDSARPQLVQNSAEAALFLTADGKPLDDATLRALVRDAAHEAGLHQGVTPSILHQAGLARPRVQPCNERPALAMAATAEALLDPV